MFPLSQQQIVGGKEAKEAEEGEEKTRDREAREHAILLVRKRAGQAPPLHDEHGEAPTAVPDGCPRRLSGAWPGYVRGKQAPPLQKESL